MATEATEKVAEPRGHAKTYPLNSTRLTASVVSRIATGLGLPKASLADSRQMVEGSLAEVREPRNVQVELDAGEDGLTIRLRDAGGVFLEVPPGPPEGGDDELDMEKDGDDGGGERNGRERSGSERSGSERSGGGSSDGGSGMSTEGAGALAAELESARARVAGLEEELRTSGQRNTDLEREVRSLTDKREEELRTSGQRNTDLEREVRSLTDKLGEEKDKYNTLWRMNCDQLMEYDIAIANKEEELLSLGGRLAALEGAGAREVTERSESKTLPSSLAHATGREHVTGRSEAGRASHHGPCAGTTGETLCRRRSAEPHVVESLTTAAREALGGRRSAEPHVVESLTTAARETRGSWRSAEPHVADNRTTAVRRGKAPPVDSFSGDTDEITFDDWLPALQRAAEWNGWSEAETLMQLAGHLRGRALQEWTLLRAAETDSLQPATKALRNRLDPGSRAVAAQDFRHASQRDGEPVSDYIRRLEQLFRRAYGHEWMSDDTRDTLLHGQLQEGLCYALMTAPAVSGSRTYQELCRAARNEEKRLTELARRREYHREQTGPGPQERGYQGTQRYQGGQRAGSSRVQPRASPATLRECFKCHQVGHLQRDCPNPEASPARVSTSQVRATAGTDEERGEGSGDSWRLLRCLDSDSGDDLEVRQVRITNRGSKQQYANVQVEGVPAQGIIDSGSEITIMGEELFCKVAAVARLRKSQFKNPDKVPRTYDGRIFALHGKLELDISFEGKTMKTPVYVKVDAPDQLLLGEGVCRQLQIISYHPAIWNRGRIRQPPPEEGDALHQQETMQRRGPSLNESQTDRRGGFQPETHVGPYNKTQPETQPGGSPILNRPQTDWRGACQPETHEDDSNPRRTAGRTQQTEIRRPPDNAAVVEDGQTESTSSPTDSTGERFSHGMGGNHKGENGKINRRQTVPEGEQEGQMENATDQTEIEEPQGVRGEQKDKEVEKSCHQTDSVGVQEGHMGCKEPWRKRKHGGHQRQSTAALGEDSQQRAANLDSTAAIASQDQMPNEDNPDARGRDTHSREAVVPQTTDGMTQTAEGLLEMETMASVDAVVPAVCVRLVQTVRVPAHRWVFARVEAESPLPPGPVLFQPGDNAERTSGLSLDDALLEPTTTEPLKIPVANRTGFTQVIEAGETLGAVSEATVIQTEPEPGEVTRVLAATVDPRKASPTESQTESFRQEKLLEAIGEFDISTEDMEAFQTFIAKHHRAFSLEDGERGETDLVFMDIETGDARPIKQRMRRMPFALRQEVTRQLRAMQETGVIQPSKSPWASPVVLVRKRDGSHRFCVDYRRLNAVTKPDTYPLPRIEDLLDQLGQAKYFSSIDLAAGYWQIQMHPGSQEKTAFITPYGLYEFRVMPFGLMNAPAVFQRLMQQVVTQLNPLEGPEFVSVYIDDILVFSRTLDDHLLHLQRVIERIVEVGLKLKPSKCKFIQKELEYLGHVVSCEGLKTTPRLVEAVERYPTPQTVQETRRFLGLSSYYRRFIPNFAKIAHPLHGLTCKDTPFTWGPDQDCAFEELKKRLTTAPVLAYPNFTAKFCMETDASVQGLGAVLSQYQEDGRLHPIAYASRALNAAEKRYGITELETLAVVWGVSHFHHYLYGNSVTIFTDHTAVKAVLESDNLTAKHARWWTRVFGRGIRKITIKYRAGKENVNADALSRAPVFPAPLIGIAEDEVQISNITASGEPPRNDMDQPFLQAQALVPGYGDQHPPSEVVTTTRATSLPIMTHSVEDPNAGDPVYLSQSQQISESHVPEQIRTQTSSSREEHSPEQISRSQPGDHPGITSAEELAAEQEKDSEVNELKRFLEHGSLPADSEKAKKMALQQTLFGVVDGVVYYIDPKRNNRKRAVAPKTLQLSLLQETHSGPYSAHFSGQRMFNILVTSWWWGKMFADACRFAKSCPECAITMGVGRRRKPPLHPIAVQRPFQILGLDVMDLPVTERGNRHVVVIQDLFTKWPFVFAVPDQKSTRIARLLAEEVIPWFGVPEALLSDRGTNLLSHLMLDLCKMLGTRKLNTTSYHPQCDGAVERFNRTLKQILRKHAARFGRQWDQFLPGVLWAYRNTRHTSTGEKPSFLLFGLDCRSPSEAAYLPFPTDPPTTIEDYREELMLSLGSARELAIKTIEESQKRYKANYDRHAKDVHFRVGDWVLVYFPQDDSGKMRKLSKPWHGPYRIIRRQDPTVVCTKVYFPDHGEMRIHQSRICPCPAEFPAGYFWYGSRRRGPGRPPRWVDRLLSAVPTCGQDKEEGHGVNGPTSQEKLLVQDHNSPPTPSLDQDQDPCPSLPQEDRETQTLPQGERETQTLLQEEGELQNLLQEQEVQTPPSVELRNPSNVSGNEREILDETDLQEGVNEGEIITTSNTQELDIVTDRGASVPGTQPKVPGDGQQIGDAHSHGIQQARPPMNEHTRAEKDCFEEKPGGGKNQPRRGRPQKQRVVEERRGDLQQERENPRRTGRLRQHVKPPQRLL